MGGGHAWGLFLVVVDEFDTAGAGFGLDKAYTPPVVYADAVLSGAAASQGFKPVAGRHREVGERLAKRPRKIASEF